jgi:membrane-associated protease RseP (regulator of RpoE activity)
MFGTDFRVRPLFWVSCALLGVIYYQYPEIGDEIGGVTAFFLWMAAVLVSMLAHEIGHALAARWFGGRARIVASGLGDQIFGVDSLRRWQRVLIALAGPLGNALILGVLWAITAVPLPIDWRFFLAPGVWVLMWINVFWCLLNLLPLWPLDGGRIAVELGTALFGRRGSTLALLLSLVVSLLLIFFTITWMRSRLTDRFDIHYPIYFTYFCILALYCYAFWLSAFRALWGDSLPENKSPV